MMVRLLAALAVLAVTVSYLVTVACTIGSDGYLPETDIPPTTEADK